MSNVVDDLAARWRRARLAALAAALPGGLDLDGAADEGSLLEGAEEAAALRALREVFDNSRKLGQSFRGYYRVDLPIGDLAELSSRLGSPCLAGGWRRESDDGVLLSERAGCGAPPHHPRRCDYWREAIDGLVLGLTSGVHHARHESRGHGGARCVDLLYVHPQSPARYGPIPEEVRAGLESLRRSTRLFDSSFDIEFLGVSERILYYAASAGGGAGDFRLISHVERGVRRRFPWLTPREVSPRPVLAGESP